MQLDTFIRYRFTATDAEREIGRGRGRGREISAKRLAFYWPNICFVDDFWPGHKLALIRPEILSNISLSLSLAIFNVLKRISQTDRGTDGRKTDGSGSKTEPKLPVKKMRGKTIAKRRSKVSRGSAQAEAEAG